MGLGQGKNNILKRKIRANNDEWAVIRHRDTQKFLAGKRGIPGHGTGHGTGQDDLVARVYQALFYGLIV